MSGHGHGGGRLGGGLLGIVSLDPALDSLNGAIGETNFGAESTVMHDQWVNTQPVYGVTDPNNPNYHPPTPAWHGGGGQNHWDGHGGGGFDPSQNYAGAGGGGYDPYAGYGYGAAAQPQYPGQYGQQQYPQQQYPQQYPQQYGQQGIQSQDWENQHPELHQLLLKCRLLRKQRREAKTPQQKRNFENQLKTTEAQLKSMKSKFGIPDQDFGSLYPEMGQPFDAPPAVTTPLWNPSALQQPALVPLAAPLPPAAASTYTPQPGAPYGIAPNGKPRPAPPTGRINGEFGAERGDQPQHGEFKRSYHAEFGCQTGRAMG